MQLTKLRTLLTPFSLSPHNHRTCFCISNDRNVINATGARMGDIKIDPVIHIKLDIGKVWFFSLYGKLLCYLHRVLLVLIIMVRGRHIIFILIDRMIYGKIEFDDVENMACGVILAETTQMALLFIEILLRATCCNIIIYVFNTFFGCIDWKWLRKSLVKSKTWLIQLKAETSTAVTNWYNNYESAIFPA